MNIGESINYYRQLSKYSRETLGSLIGRSQHTIKKYELGEVVPTFNIIEKIATTLNVEVSDLLGLTNKSKPLPNNLGEAIKYHRELKKLTQTDLAKLIDKSLRMVQKYEVNEVIPSLEMIKNISKALDVSGLKLLETYFEGDSND